MVVWIVRWVLAALVLPTAEGVTVVVGVSRGCLMAWVLLVLVLGAACVWVVGGPGRATRGWCLAGLWTWRCRLSLVLGYFLRLSFGL